MKKKFGFLRFIAGLYKVLGIITLVVGILIALGVFIAGVTGGSALADTGRQFGPQNLSVFTGVLGGILGAVVVLIVFVLSAIFQFALGEAIVAFLSIEENTRATAGLLSARE